MVVFKASEKLATAYGVAVTMDLMLTTTLFCVYAAAKLNWARWQILAFALVFGLIEFNFFAVSTRVSNIPHVPAEQRVRVDDLGDPYDHISHVTLNFGFQDDQGVPAGLALAVITFFTSESGKRLIAFGRDSWREVQKVVWPTRKETLQTTAFVFAFAVLMALFLWLTDKTLEWALYDLVLGWRR